MTKHLTAMENKNDMPKLIKVCNIMKSRYQSGNVYDPNGLSPTVMDNHGYPVFIIEETSNDKDNER